MHLVRFSCLLIVTLVSLLLYFRRDLLSRHHLTRHCLCRWRHCGSRTSPSVTRFPVCVAAVLDAVDGTVYLSIVFKCRC